MSRTVTAHTSASGDPSGLFAVLDGHRLHVWDEACTDRTVATPDDLAELRRVYGFKQLWVINSDVLPPEGGYVRRGDWSITWPGQPGPAMMWAGVDGRALYDQLHAFETALGVPWVQSGAITSDVLLRDTHRRAPMSVAQVPAVARPADGLQPEARETDILWWRTTPLTATERKARYVHHYDLNAAYLAAACSVRLPRGAPLYRAGERTVAQAAADGMPGYYRIAGPGGGPWEPTHDLWASAPGAVRWVTLPSLELLAVTGGAELGVVESWQYPNHTAALRPWYERIRDARAALAGAGHTQALAAVKSVYRAGVGRMGSTQRTRPPDRDPLYQPVWRHHVIAECKSRVWRRFAPCQPLAVEVDGAWILSDIADATSAAVAVGLAVDDLKLGAVKCKGTGAGAAAVKAMRDAHPIQALREVTGA